MLEPIITILSGHLTAACISIQEKLNRPLLWLACRHHMGETILTHVWDLLKVEVSKSPEYEIFKRFKRCFESLSFNELDNVYRPNLNSNTWLEQKVKEVHNLCNGLLQDIKNTDYFIRGDYRELAELVVFFSVVKDSLSLIDQGLFTRQDG